MDIREGLSRWDERCPACGLPHDDAEWRRLGIVCTQCGHHTGSEVRHHYLEWCRVTKTRREMHFCCPGRCQLEMSNGK